MTDLLTPEAIEELERLEREATAGPWHREYLELSPGGVMTLGIGGKTRPVCIVNGIVESPPGLRDVEFIATFRNAAPQLIASARRSLEYEAFFREHSTVVRSLLHEAQDEHDQPGALRLTKPRVDAAEVALSALLERLK